MDAGSTHQEELQQIESKIDALKWIAGTSDDAIVRSAALREVFELRRQQLEMGRAP